MTSQLTYTRSKFGVRAFDSRVDSSEQKRLNQLYPKLNKPEIIGSLKSQFGGLTPQILLTKHNGENWMKKRNILSKEKTNKKHIEYAKQLFLSRDTGSNAELRPREIVKSLISVGISTDSKHAYELLQSLDIKKA